MTVMKAPPPAPADLSVARLHGEVCFWCGAAHLLLTPAGAVSTPAPHGVRIWHVNGCPRHAARRLR